MSRTVPILLGFSLAIAAITCGGKTTEADGPQAALSTTFRAQKTLGELEAVWSAATPKERLALEPRIRQVLHLHGNDPRAITLRQYLAWILLERGDLHGCEQILLTERAVPQGTAADFARVLSAGIQLRRSNTAGALDQLQKIQGVLIVTDHRIICDQLLIEAALACGKIDLATKYMLDLLLNAPAVQQEAMRQKIDAWFDSVSTEQLEDAYSSLTRAEAANSTVKRDHARAVTFLVTVVRRKLLASALKGQDAALAKRIIDHYVPDGDTEELARLAATGKLPPRIVGRSLGLILELGTVQQGQRASQVAIGVSEALDLLSSPNNAKSEVTLRTRTAGEDPASLKLAFEQLTAEGAALVITGLTQQSADVAVGLAEQMRVPTLILWRPTKLASAPRFSFVLGESSARVSTALSAWAKAHHLEPHAIVEEMDARCEAEAASIGAFVFPVADWKKSKLASVLMLGSEECSSTLLNELQRVQLTPTVLLGLDSTALLHRAPRAVTVRAGSFPPSARKQTDPHGDRGSWFYALGHDAGLLAAHATQELDSVMTNQPEEVALVHSKVASALRTAPATGLTTTSEPGFNPQLVLERKLDVTAVQSP